MLLQTFDLKHGAFVESSMNLGFIVGAEIWELMSTDNIINLIS